MTHRITPINSSITPDHSTPSRPTSTIRQTLSRLCFWKAARSPGSASSPCLDASIFSTLSSPASRVTSPRASTTFFSKNPLFTDDDDLDIPRPKEGYIDPLPPTEDEIERLPEIMETIAQIAESRRSLIETAAKAPTPPPRKRASEQPLPPIPAEDPIYNENIYVQIDEIPFMTPKRAASPLQPQPEIKHPSPKRPKPQDPTPAQMEKLSQIPPLTLSDHEHNSSFVSTRSVRRRLFSTKASRPLFDHSQV